MRTANHLVLGTVLSLVMIGCGSRGGGTVVVPSTPPQVQDNFFATWEIQSNFYGPLDCFQAGAASVDMDIVNVDTSNRFVYSFACSDYQGTSGPVDVGRFDVLMNLTDARGGVLSQIDVGTENVSTAGTIDLGHVIFTLP
ncbi:MAG: hypothetical protein JWN44_1225 [Myxococcales bacterium]|nr:hypothetical protein [Myxococcales bacterium]